MRLIDLNGQGGNQDRSLSAQGVFGPGSLRIIKSVSTFETPSSVSSVEFFFTMSNGFLNTNYTLIDDDLAGCGPAPATPCGPELTQVLSDPILTFDGTANVITVTEDDEQFPLGWSFAGASCTSNGSPVFYPAAGSGDPGVVVTVAAEATVVCTFFNSNLTPGAAPATVSGGVRVTMMNAQTGEMFTAITNSFGYYTIEGPEVNNFYMMTVSHKRYVFADGTRSFTLNEDLVGVDFIANPLD